MKTLVGWLINALSLYVADYLIVGIAFDNWQTLLISALILGIINSLLKPIVQLVALPITIFTLGLFALIVNTALFALAAWLIPGFSIDSFWSAFFGAILVSITSTFLNSAFKETEPTHG